MAPVGAGPGRFVRQEPSIEVEFAAFRDYWRKVSHVQILVSRRIREVPVRVAALKSGEPTSPILSPGSCCSR